VGAGQLYGFRVHGPFDPSRGHRFNPSKLLVDPWAAATTGEPPLDDAFAGSRRDDDGVPDLRDTAAIAPKSIVVDRAFEWGGDRPPAVPWKETVIYECHVRGVSIRHPEVPEALRGTYGGLVSEPILDHLTRLGITTVELLPVQQIASEPHLLKRGFHNYFGYSPLAFYAPHGGYAQNPLGGQVAEFKSMVKGLHARGIEVILDLVLNHTAEGDHRGRTLSLRGIDNRTFYRLRPDDPSRYYDTTGCGNALAAENPAVADFLVACLRFWVEEMHVDGFRLDLAVSLGRTSEGFDPAAPFFEKVAGDPIVSRAKLIAEPWDLGPRGYRLGQFPPGWSEWNDRFRDTVRGVWRGERKQRRHLQTSVDGSPKIFDPNSRGAGINFVTCHDGFTLDDLVSYEHKHNWDNGEENRDGSTNNLSRNWGAEGATDSIEILTRRDRAKRNLLATLLLSRGVPMLLHGDELGRSQWGNNNAYCHDSEKTWLDWDLDDRRRAFLAFTSEVLALRRALEPSCDEPACERRWISFQGTVPQTTDRDDGAHGLLITRRDRSYLLLLNVAQHARLVRLPKQVLRGRWRRVLSTVESGRRRHDGATYRLAERSVSLLEFVSETD